MANATQSTLDPAALKQAVAQHWEDEPCNIRSSTASDRRTFFREVEANRYRMEPNIPRLARFEESKGKEVLEIGVGAGVDFVQWVRNGAKATGIDLTEKGIALTSEWLTLEGYDPSSYSLRIADAENLPFPDESFDIVFSYGVLHHTPNTLRAYQEAWRVLRKGGQLRTMIYHCPSVTAINLWLYHGLLRCQPWKSPRRIMYEYLESPGTKSYTVAEVKALARQAGIPGPQIETILDCGDLLNIKLSKRYDRNWLVKFAMLVYPRPLIKLLGNRCGSTMHVCATK
jgi:ubiquinone/menaquinone biosynthesis C-methylase UbiE